MGKLISSAAKEGRTVTLVGALVNGVLIVIKFGAGILGQSQALIADAVHSLSDLVTDLIVFVGLKMGRKAPDEKHQFGHARIETLASSLVGVALIATAIFIGIKASLAIYLHTESHPTKLALIGALVSILLKEWLYHYTLRVGRRAKSRLIVANAWHHRSDSLSSVAVVLGVGGSLVHPSWHALDSYAALLVSFFILKVGLETLWDSLREFTDTAPPPEVMETIRTCAMK
ncbi:MAG: cation diffusion facilitator family transporter, partial [Deltaproteobacteria bacterium]